MATLAAPMLQAGDPNYDEFSDQVNSDVSLKYTLEQQYQKVTSTLQSWKDSLAAKLKSEPTDPYERSRWQQEVDDLKAKINDGDGVVDRTKTQLQSVYNRLEGYRQTAMKSKDPKFQQLGDMVGAAGVAAFPLYIRPTAGELAASAKYMATNARVTTMNWRVGADGTGGLYNKMATGLEGISTSQANAASNAAANKPVWEVVQTNQHGGYVVKPRLPDGTFGKGSITVPKNLKPGTRPFTEFVNYHTSLQNSYSTVTTELAVAQHKLASGVTGKTADFYKGRVESLTVKKAALEADIAKFKETTPEYAQPKGQLKTMATSAAKWALFSAGITIGSHAFMQMKENGWDPRKVDWGAAVGQIMTREWLGGTAGSFLGSFGASMILSAILPGAGPFLRVLTAVGGAALGWQVGSGGLAQTDWLGLGVGVLGATLGVLIGQAVFWFMPGLGAVIGGIAGQIVATWLLGKVREWLAQPTSATTPTETAYDYGKGCSAPAYNDTGSGYQGASPLDSGGYGDSSSYGTSASQNQVEQVKTERDRAYNEWLSAQEDPNVPLETKAALHKEYVRLTEELRAAQRAAAAAGYK